jgi:3-oxoacyl-[acyl-carrier-protein] synthase II
LLGAAGALEAVVTILALRRQQLPPNAHCEAPDAQCGVHLVLQTQQAADGVNAALSSSFAFGGTNAVLVFKRA